jgi:arginyl-tRNA synthetase
MKSREGTVVDADDLIDRLHAMALEEIRGKEREDAVGNPEEIAEKIALGALHYFLLQVSPVKDMLFDPNESLSFNGNTGPYLQYMGARISSLLRKAGAEGAEGDPASASCCSLLVSGAEWDVIKLLAGYHDAIRAAAAGLDPSVLAGYLYELSRAFSRFYHDCPILSAEKAELVRARLALSRAVLRVLRSALHLICIPFLEVM